MSMQFITYRNISIRVRYCSTYVSQRSQMRYDLYLFESRRITIDAQHDSVQFYIGTCSPRMTIRACVIDIRDLRPGRHTHRKIFFPYAEPFQIIISETGFGQCLVDVELEINCGLCEKRIID